MISQGAFTGNIDHFNKKTWNIADQLVCFTGPFVASTQSTSLLIEPITLPLGLTDALLRNGHVLEGQDLSESFLNQSLEYFQKALYNFNSQYLLAKNGYSTWAGVTNYYSSYFSVFALLSLQGRAITRIKFDGINDITCLIHPIDFRNHKYLLTTRENRVTTHKLPWDKYYDIYNNYPCLKPEFDIVQQKSLITDPKDESENRNRINYKIYEGFQEIVDIANLTAFKSQYLMALTSPLLGDIYQNYLTALRALATDPDLMYFARSAIRLLLIRTIFEEIGKVNTQFKVVFEARIPVWNNTMFDNYNPKVNYYEDFVNTFFL